METTLAESPAGLPDANGNLIGGQTNGVVDPLLGPLADNGGFTLPYGSHILTQALLSGSPAINTGDLNATAGENGVPEFDERGAPFGRVFGGRIDIGAVESQPNLLPGDYNFDGVVDAADYTVWRDTIRSPFDFPTKPLDLRADGDGSGVVDQADYDIWKAHFGNVAGSGSGAAAVNVESAGGSGKVVLSRSSPRPARSCKATP